MDPNIGFQDEPLPTLNEHALACAMPMSNSTTLNQHAVSLLASYLYDRCVFVFKTLQNDYTIAILESLLSQALVALPR